MKIKMANDLPIRHHFPSRKALIRPNKVSLNLALWITYQKSSWIHVRSHYPSSLKIRGKMIYNGIKQRKIPDGNIASGLSWRNTITIQEPTISVSIWRSYVKPELTGLAGTSVTGCFGRCLLKRPKTAFSLLKISIKKKESTLLKNYETPHPRRFSRPRSYWYPESKQ